MVLHQQKSNNIFDKGVNSERTNKSIYNIGEKLTSWQRKQLYDEDNGTENKLMIYTSQCYYYN